MNSDFEIEDLPTIVPLFPIDQFLLLPETRLSAAIASPLFCGIVDAAAEAGGFVGVVQTRQGESPRPRRPDEPEFYSVGCLGRLEVLGRGEHMVHITLEGLIRFRVREELGGARELPRAAVDYQEFAHDLEHGEEEIEGLDLENFRATLIGMIESIAPDLDVSSFKAMNGRQVLRSLAQMVRLTPAEKQTILEAPGFKEMAEAFFFLLAMNYSTPTPDTSPPSRVN